MPHNLFLAQKRWGQSEPYPFLDMHHLYRPHDAYKINTHFIHVSGGYIWHYLYIFISIEQFSPVTQIRVQTATLVYK